MTVSKIFLTLLLCGTIKRCLMNHTSSNLTQNGSDGCSSSAAKLKEPAVKAANVTWDPSSKSCSNSRYRSFDGSCNNLQIPNWGAANTPYVRLTKENYADGISEMPRSVTGCQLPNARELSFRLFLNKLVLNHKWNLNAAQWGQIITHDMSKTAEVAQIRGETPITRCCDNPGANKNPTCAPILFPPNDPIHKIDGRRCMNFKRTGTTRNTGCAAANTPAEQLTSVTAFMDLSVVYGSSDSRIARLRAGTRGKMLTVIRNGQEWPPQVPNATLICAQSASQPCYLTGDDRVNQNSQLTVLQVILLREHNRLADKLASLNPHWNDEKVFQEARRIHIAQIQHINYYEYLPILLGSENMVKNKLIYRGVVGYVNDYNPNVNPSIINEHATAAFRHFHNLIRGLLKLLSENRQLVETVRLSDWLDKPQLLEINDGLNKLTRGLTTEKMRCSDQYWAAELTDFFFKGNKTFGDDLRAADIQRGRDHGLGSYIAARAACDLPIPKTFDDMCDYISKENLAVLRSLYASPEDVDLVVAGSLEHNVRGAMSGPTFLCILTKQFYRTRVGDRFFYENGADPDIAFTPDQLEAIRKGANMARVLCDNANGIHHMQPKAFQLVSEDNQMTSCYHLPAINLTLWQTVDNHLENKK